MSYLHKYYAVADMPADMIPDIPVTIIFSALRSRRRI